MAAPVVTITWPFSRRWLKNWGSTVSERNRPWPGDTLVSSDSETYTRAVSIEADPEQVWQWVVQFGLGRAGFYSYELLERLAGIPVTNLQSIDPTLQSLSVGDAISLHPTAPSIPVALLEYPKYICFGERDSAARAAGPDPARSWSLYLERASADQCRLLLRSCIEPMRSPTFAKWLAGKLEVPVDFVMEQRMLRTIKRLAERRMARPAA